MKWGNAVRFSCFLFLQVGQRFLPVFVFSLRAGVRNPFSGANFCFGCLVVVLCVSVVFYLHVCLFFGFWCPNRFYKNSLHVRFSFLGFVLSVIGFATTTFVFFSKRHSSGLTGHHTPLHVFGLFLFLAAVVSSPVLAVRPFFLAFCRGAILGPEFFGVFGFSRNFAGLELARPL